MIDMKTLQYAVRFLLRARSYTLINLLGLAFSLACCIVLVRYIHRELAVDSHCVDRNGVYAVEVEMEGNRYLGAFSVMQDSVLIDLKLVEEHVVYTPLENDFFVCGGHRYRVNAIVTDSAYFKLFPYRAVQGELTLDAPESALITESCARRVFGKENPVGKVFRFSNGKEFTIKAVLAEPADKRSLQFDMVLSSTASALWDRMPSEYFKFVPNADIEALDRIGAYARPVNPGTPDPRRYRFSFISVRDCYWSGLGTYDEEQIYVWGDRSQLRIFAGVCLLLLLTGVLNFINLYMVFMLKRTREYGLRKVFGAGRLRLFLQIYVENLVLIGLAEILAWVFVELTSVPVGRFFGHHFVYTGFDWWLTFGLLVLLPLVASFYPYRSCTRSVPVTSIRLLAGSGKAVRVRTGLLFVQYVLSFLLIMLALYFNRQLDRMLHTNPGYRTKDIIVARLINESRDYSVYRAGAAQARQNRVRQMDALVSSCPDIEVWASERTYMHAGDYEMKFYNDKGEPATMYLWYAGADFFRLYDLKFIEGGLPDEVKSGEGYSYCFVVNRAALKALGYESCKGKTLVSDYDRRVSSDASYPIVGVIEDYYDGHVSAGVRPIVYQVSNSSSGDLYQMAVRPGKVKAVLDYLRKIEKEIYGVEEFEYFMLKDKVDEMYESDRRVAAVYSVFALIGIVVSCLGLFGISLFDIRQRYREIAIRKVNGARLPDLYRLLCGKYLKVLVTSFALAAPLGWYIIYRYTEDFVVKAPIGVGIFIFAFALVALISLGTLFWQVNKAARINPAQIIKTE